MFLREIDNAAVGEVTIESRLVDGHDRAEAHRDRGEFPELGHQPGMRIRRQTAAGLQLAAEVDEVFFGEPAFEERAGVHAGRSVALEIDLIAVVAALAAAAEEVVHRHFVQRGGRCVRRDVSADAVEVAIRADDHRHGVPANEALDAAFELALAGVARLLIERNRVDVRRRGRERKLDTVANRGLFERGEKLLHALGAFALQHIVERLQPFGGFGRINVVRNRRVLFGGVSLSHGGLPTSLILCLTQRRRGAEFRGGLWNTDQH